MQNTSIDEFMLFPPARHPYYIVTPRYSSQSAGIKSLHLLCHALNRRGQQAWLVGVDGDGVRAFQPVDVHPNLLTPVLTAEVEQAHARAGRAPVVVYPETIRGNPLRAAVVVRYVMNFPGLLGGDKTYPPDEIVYAYSKVLAAAADVGDDRILFVPASDTMIFNQEREQARSGTCYYAGKYRDIHKGELFDVTRDSVEIRRGINAQTPQQIAELFRRSELFYVYENTALAIEARLCGCPTVFLPNEHLTQIIGLQELGMEGFAWGTEPADVERARVTVNEGNASYFKLYRRFWEQLDGFVTLSQERAGALPPPAAEQRLHAQAPAFRSIRKLSVFRKTRRILMMLVYLGLLGLAYWLGGR